MNYTDNTPKGAEGFRPPEDSILFHVFSQLQLQDRRGEVYHCCCKAGYYYQHIHLLPPLFVISLPDDYSIAYSAEYVKQY